MKPRGKGARRKGRTKQGIQKAWEARLAGWLVGCCQNQNQGIQKAGRLA